MPKIARLVTSTADLEGSGRLGAFRKAVYAAAGFVGALLAFLQPYVAVDSPWARWLGLAIAAVGFAKVYFAPNDLAPVAVVDDSGNLED
jgi:hypothetical protein